MCRDSGSGNLEAQHPMSAELEMQLRLQYAMTVVRLVNGISDSSQKGKVATSVAVLATKSGGPLNAAYRAAANMSILCRAFPDNNPEKRH
jgi:hypothetical protein